MHANEIFILGARENISLRSNDEREILELKNSKNIYSHLKNNCWFIDALIQKNK